MYLHIVMMSFQQPPGATLLEELGIIFQKTVQILKGIEHFQLIENHSKTSAHFSHALLSSFSNLDALNAYRHSPTHKEMIAALEPYIDNIIVLDSPLDAFPQR